jgi:hypothetical protein
LFASDTIFDTFLGKVRPVPLQNTGYWSFFYPLSARKTLKILQIFPSPLLPIGKILGESLLLIPPPSQIKRLGSPLANNTILSLLEKLPSVALANNNT